MLFDLHAHPVVAHRGARAHSPENTLVAFAAGLAAGADALEFDVRLTADGHIVACHDPTVDRTTDGTGTIAELPLAAIREFDAGARWSAHTDPEHANGGARDGATPFRGQGVHVPLLGEVLEAFPSVPLIIDLKTERVGEAIVDALKKFGAQGRVLLGSFLHLALLPARRAGFRTTASQPEIARLLVPAVFRQRARTIAFDAIALPPSHYGIPLPVAGFVYATGVPVHVWTVNDPVAAREHWGAGACGIITDDPAAIVAERARATAG